MKDLKNVMQIYQSWHFSLMPKVEFNYFLDRITKLGLKPMAKGYMGRLRQVYKGLIDFSAFEDASADPTGAAVANSETGVAVPGPAAVPVGAAVSEAKKAPETAPLKPTIPQDEEDLALEHALQVNEDADEIDDEDEYFGRSEAAKVRINHEAGDAESVPKKHGLEPTENSAAGGEKKYKLHDNNDDADDKPL